MVSRIEDGEVEISSRNGKVWTGVLGKLAKAVAKLPLKSAWLDGEIVVMDARGITSFNALQNALADRNAELVYILFDVMHLDGYDLTAVPLVERKRVLAGLLAKVDPDGPLRYSPDIQDDGPEFFAQACDLGLEGVISKRADSPYRTAARSREWLKVKCAQRQEMVIGGYTDPQGSRSGFGALLLGVYDNGELKYAGKVGTGFDTKTLGSIKKLLAAREQDAPPFANPPRGFEAKGAHWVKPDLVAEVSFTEWSPEGALRHPSFQGLREDKQATDVKRERPAATSSGNKGSGKASEDPADDAPKAGAAKSGRAKAAAATNADSPDGSSVRTVNGGKAPTIVAGVSLSNPDKPYFPEVPFTKADLARYYEAVAPWILPHLKNRPLSLVRCPDGWNGQCFYQKNADKAVNAAVDRVEVPESKGTATYMAAGSATALVGLVQWGCIELHPWGSRTPNLGKPDQLIFDFDPDDGLKWETLVEAVHLLRTVLDDLGLVGFLKTTGGKGLHVVLPIRATLTWDEAKGFTGAIAELLAKTIPDRFTSVMSKERRKGKIFIDYLRNGQGATAIAPYSVRARAGAPVSTPISWDELKRDVRFDFFNARTVLERLAKLKADPWADFFATKQTVTKAMLERVHYKPQR
jgi:bifunctional non-homologous end joining protein LigD